MSSQRTPEEIRASIESHRTELARAVTDLSVATTNATDWRRHVRRRPRELTGVAAAAGFLLGGGLIALGGILSR